MDDPEQEWTDRRYDPNDRPDERVDPSASDHFMGPPVFWHSQAVLPPRPNTPRTDHPGFWLALAAGLAGYAALWFVGDLIGIGGELRLFAASGLESLPFVPLSLFACASRRSALAGTLTLLYWIVLVGGSALVVWMLTTEFLLHSGIAQSLSESGGILRGGTAIHSGKVLLVFLSLFGVSFGVLAGLLCYLPEFRRAAALVLPIDAESFVHATALATVVGLTIIAFVPLIVLGEPPLLMMNPLSGELKTAQDAAQADRQELRSTVYAFVWLVPSTIVVVGFPLQRTLGGALRRLGLVVPSLRQTGLPLALVPILVVTMNGADKLIESVWTRFDWPTTNSKAFEELIKFAFNPAGAIIIGVTAGLGEELSVRGVLQPRLGILLSNLFFTGLHALQYNWDGLLSVFLIGLGLGVLRKYTNTTTSAIVHGGYDFTLVMAEVIARLQVGAAANP